MEQPYEKIFNMLLNTEEITWQSIIYDLVKSEQMSPWDVNISLITQKYIERIRSLQEHDFRVSGKVLLAAALLLKIKANRWVQKDIAALDSLFLSAEEDMDEFFNELDELSSHPKEKVDAQLIPRTPQPRKRKVSVYDLVKALEKALEVKQRRILRNIPDIEVRPPAKKRDISEIIKEIYQRIVSYFGSGKNRLTFSRLIPSETKEDKVYTFIPLLHLTNLRKIDMRQYQHFGEIEILLRKEMDINKEIPKASSKN